MQWDVHGLLLSPSRLKAWRQLEHRTSACLQIKTIQTRSDAARVQRGATPGTRAVRRKTTGMATKNHAQTHLRRARILARPVSSNSSRGSEPGIGDPAVRRTHRSAARLHPGRASSAASVCSTACHPGKDCDSFEGHTLVPLPRICGQTGRLLTSPERVSQRRDWQERIGPLPARQCL